MLSISTISQFIETTVIDVTTNDLEDPQKDLNPEYCMGFQCGCKPNH